MVSERSMDHGGLSRKSNPVNIPFFLHLDHPSCRRPEPGRASSRLFHTTLPYLLGTDLLLRKLEPFLTPVTVAGRVFSSCTTPQSFLPFIMCPFTVEARTAEVCLTVYLFAQMDLHPRIHYKELLVWVKASVTPSIHTEPPTETPLR